MSSNRQHTQPERQRAIHDSTGGRVWGKSGHLHLKL